MIDNLTEAIAHEREVIEELKKEADTNRDSWGNIDIGCLERVNEHEQLASWLTELQERREADKWIPIETEKDLPKYDGFYHVTIEYMESSSGKLKPYESEAENE